MGCGGGAFRIERGLGWGPYRILWLWLRGFERMRSSSKGQAEAAAARGPRCTLFARAAARMRPSRLKS